MPLIGAFNQPYLLSTMTPSNDFPENSLILLPLISWNIHITSVTRFWVLQTLSVLDLIFANEELMVETVDYLEPLGKSDLDVLSFDYV